MAGRLLRLEARHGQTWPDMATDMARIATDMARSPGGSKKSQDMSSSQVRSKMRDQKALSCPEGGEWLAKAAGKPPGGGNRALAIVCQSKHQSMGQSMRQHVWEELRIC